MYMECYRTIFLSGTEGGEVLYIHHTTTSEPYRTYSDFVFRPIQKPKASSRVHIYMSVMNTWP